MRKVNWIFLGLIVISVVTAAFNGSMHKVASVPFTSTKAAMELVIGLIGQMTLWLGLVGILRQAGLLRSLGNALKPLMSRLFPEVPADHPAMGAMIMNLAANALGLGNAATPFGLKAMQELDQLNTKRGVATNSMALFLAINTTTIALPLSAIAVRASAGSKDPAGIIVPTLVAAACATLCSVIACKLLERSSLFALSRYSFVETSAPPRPSSDSAALEKAEELASIAPKMPLWRKLVAASIGAAVLLGLVRTLVAAPPSQTTFDVTKGLLSDWLLPLLILTVVTLGFGRQVKVYEAFIGGAKEGFQTVISLIPFLVGVLLSVGMFRESGALDVLVSLLAPLIAPIGFPPEALPMALIRPLSGSGALGVMTEALKVYGPDSFVGYLISVLNGSTETTFYVLALYFGTVQVKALRHALLACLIADVAGPLGAFAACKFFFASAP